MARTIEEIKNEMTAAFMADEAAQTAYGFAEGTKFAARFSALSVESILFYVFAVCAYAVERLAESHLAEVSDTVRQLRPHTLVWYQAKALAFRYGEAVDGTTADYAAEATADTVTPVAQCAVTEAEGGGLVFKVATTADDGGLTYLAPDHLAAFTAYIGRVKDAGVKTTIISRAGDRLTLSIVVYVDGTVFTADGSLIASPARPVEDAVREYLTLLPFNGELVLEHLTDHLQKVDGVEVPHIVEASTAAVAQAAQSESGYDEAKAVDVRATPESGYFIVSFDPADPWASTVEYRFKP